MVEFWLYKGTHGEQLHSIEADGSYLPACGDSVFFNNYVYKVIKRNFILTDTIKKVILVLDVTFKL